jgi:hypothetical protein
MRQKVAVVPTRYDFFFRSNVDEGELGLLLLLEELEEHGECFQRPRLQLEVHVVLGWAKYSYLARTLGNFAGQDHRQGVQSCTGKRNCM